MSYTVTRGTIEILTFQFFDAFTSGTFTGTSLTNVSIEAVVYSSGSLPATWSLGNTVEYDSGTAWKLQLEQIDTNQDYDHGIISINADEIQELELQINFEGDLIELLVPDSIPSAEAFGAFNVIWKPGSTYYVKRHNLEVLNMLFYDKTLPGLYNGSTLTNVNIAAIVYSDTKPPEIWTLSNSVVYVSGTTWSLQLEQLETNKDFEFGVISISADEIQDSELNIIFFGPLAQFLAIPGIATQETFGDFELILLPNITPDGIASQEAFGSLVVANIVLNAFQQLMEEDLDNIFDEMNEFSISGVVQHKNGATYSIPVIFDNEYTEINSGGYAPVISRQPMITCKDRFLVRPSRGDKFRVNNINYQILTYEPDGTGVAIITLQHERTN